MGHGHSLANIKVPSDRKSVLCCSTLMVVSYTLFTQRTVSTQKIMCCTLLLMFQTLNRIGAMSIIQPPNCCLAMSQLNDKLQSVSLTPLKLESWIICLRLLYKFTQFQNWHESLTRGLTSYLTPVGHPVWTLFNRISFLT